MDNVQKFIIKMVLENEDQNRFLFNRKDVRHGDKSSINSFFLHLENESQSQLQMNLTASELENIWYKMRQKFVKLNLKKARMELVSNESDLWYRFLIFLEDYITHKGADVYLTKNRKDIAAEVFEELMGNVETNNDGVNAVEYEVNSETEELDVLDGYENFVKKFVERNDDQNIQNINDVNVEVQMAVPDSQQQRNPLPCTLNEEKSKNVVVLARMRGKNDLMALKMERELKSNIVELLFTAIIESNTESLRLQRLDIIVSSIDKALSYLKK